MQLIRNSDWTWVVAAFILRCEPRALRFERQEIDNDVKGQSMKGPIANAQPVPEVSLRARWALVSLGLWLRVGSAGALGVAAGLFELFNGEMKPLSALALAAGAGALIAVAWWRAKAALHVAVGDSVTPAEGSSPAYTAIRAGV